MNTSASSFIIRATFTLDPNIGSVPLEVGVPFTVYWVKQGNIPNVKLMYSPDNFFSDFRPIEPTAAGIVANTDSCTNDPTKGCYVWTVPDIEDAKDTNVKFKLADPNDLDAYTISNPFTIIPRFTVVAPNGNADVNLTQKLKVGTPYTISWTSTSSQAKTPRVTLLYSVTGGAPYDKTIGTVDNTGTYNWVTANGGVPDDISTQVRVGVRDASDNIAFDESNYNFRIISDILLSAPNGGLTYDSGDPFTVTWTNKGTVPHVELTYSTAGANFTTPTPVTIHSQWPNGAGIGTTYAWTIPDAIGRNVRVRVRSLTDESLDISDADFRIRGKIVPDSPDSADRVPIGKNFTIRWRSYGSIPNVKIHYDTANGAGGYPYQIVSSAPGCAVVAPATYCDGTYVWTNIPDTAAAQARVRIADTRPLESDVVQVTEPFQIIGNFTIVSLNGGQVLRVAENHDIVWTWGGTIPVVKLYYTRETGDPDSVAWTEIDPLVVKNFSGDGKQQNGANNTIQRKYTWTIPDDIAPALRIKVADATNPAVYDVSDAPFKIRGDFLLTSPNGDPDLEKTERYVTSVYTSGEGQVVTWNTTGTIPNVKLEYSNDDFVDDIHTVTESAPNKGSYYWEIPDAVLKDVEGRFVGPNLIKIRVVDANDPDVYDGSENPFYVDYYYVKWIVRDLSTYNLLSELGVREVKTQDLEYTFWAEGGMGATQPDPGGYTRIQPTPAGTWLATWSKTGYGDMAQVVTLSKKNSTLNPPLETDPTYMLLMETTAVHIYISDSRFTYDPGTDKMDVVAWLSRDGSLLTGVLNAEIEIYDGTTLLTGAPIVLAETGEDTGIFGAVLENVGEEPYNLKSGKTYLARVKTQIASQVPNNVWYQTPTAFEITTPSKLQEVVDTVNEKLDKPISEVSNELNAQLLAQTITIQSAMEEQTEFIDEKMTEQTQIIKDSLAEMNASMNAALVALEDSTAKSLVAVKRLEDTSMKFSWKATVSPNPALIGEVVTIQAQGIQKLKPLLSIYNNENTQVFSNVQLAESAVNPGNYYFSFQVATGSFTAGKSYTFVVSEETTGGLASGSGVIESTTLGAIMVLVASAPGAEQAAKEALDAIQGLEAVMTKGGDVAGLKAQIADIKSTVDQLPNLLKSSLKSEKPEDSISGVNKTLEAMALKLESLAGKEGYDLSELVGRAISTDPTIKEIRQKSDDIDLGVAVVQKTIEAKLGTTEDPIIMVSYTSGSVVLRVVAVNPSDSKTQDVPVKIYLPQEARPDNILDRGDLEVGYDYDKATYYVFKDKITLLPKETKVFQVEIEDIWFVSDEILNRLKTQTDAILDRLKETPYFDQAKIVAATIHGRLAQIAVSQADESLNKELHIGLYRSNLKVIEEIKKDIAKLEKLLVSVGAPPAPEILAETKLNLKTPSRATTWFLIFAILVFIGLLGAVFFFTWQAQVRISKEFPESKGNPTSSPDEHGGNPPGVS
ncbi:MAG: hypothetical protein WC352_05885 [Candidatus Omnitrophota bacterium]